MSKSYLRQATTQDCLGSLSNGESALIYESTYEVVIRVCGSQEWYDNYTYVTPEDWLCDHETMEGYQEDPHPETNDVWITYCDSEDCYHNISLTDLTPEEAKTIGEEMAGIYVSKGLDSLLKEAYILKFLE